MDPDELLPLAELLVDRLEDSGRRQLVFVGGEVRLERGPRAGVRRLEVEDVAVGVDRPGDVVEVLLADLAEPELQLEVARLCRPPDR